MEYRDYIRKVSGIAAIDPPRMQGSRIVFRDLHPVPLATSLRPLIADLEHSDDVIDMIETLMARMEQANEAVDELCQVLLTMADKERMFFVHKDDFTKDMAEWLATEGDLKASFDTVRLTSVNQVLIRFDDVTDAVHFKLRWL